MRPLAALHRATAVLWACAGLAAAAAAACTDAGLQPIVEEAAPTAQDDRLEIVGEVCSDPSEDVAFPVKILFVIDTSGTMQQTDPNHRRATAVEDVVARYRNNPGVEIGIISFRESVNDLTDGFTHDRAALARAAEDLRVADSVTDYQGALGMAYQVLLDDIRSAGQAERSRSKYVVVFLSDGNPQPKCHRSRPCATDADCDRGTSCGSGECSDPFLVCEVTRDDWADIQVPEALYPALEAGADYNQPYQLTNLVDDVRALQARWGVGDIRLHTGFLFDPNTSQAWLDAFALDPVAGEELLREMALHGAGRFMNFASGDEIDFLQVDYTAIRRDFVLRSLFANNASVLPFVASGAGAADSTAGDTAALVDSDGDGLSDAAERALGTDPRVPDSDGDGFSDLLEVRAGARGFDPLDAARPSEACEEEGRRDRDGDGLNACEERFLGTAPDRFDSDRDGLPDGLEWVAGADPLAAVPDADLDGDGVRDAEEVRAHTDPARPESSDERRAAAVQPRIEPLGIEGAGRHCYAFSLRNVRLAQTLEGTLDALPGLNLTYVGFDQALEDDPNDPGDLKAACVLARWVKPYYRDPAGGTIALDRDDFHPVTELVVPDDCVGVLPSPPEAAGEEGAP